MKTTLILNEPYIMRNVILDPTYNLELYNISHECYNKTLIIDTRFSNLLIAVIPFL